MSNWIWMNFSTGSSVTTVKRIIIAYQFNCEHNLKNMACKQNYFWYKHSLLKKKDNLEVLNLIVNVYKDTKFAKT